MLHRCHHTVLYLLQHGVFVVCAYYCYSGDLVKFENPKYHGVNNGCRFSKGNVLYVGPTVGR